MFLDESERALRALPESTDTHAERAQVMQPVGTERIDERSESQFRRSIAILELYLDQVEQAYGDDAEAQHGWAPAQEYLANLRGRVSDPDLTPFLPMPSTSSTRGSREPEPTDRRNNDRTPPPGRGLVIGGGIAIGVGTVLLIAGVVQGIGWKKADNRYEDLRRQNDAGAVTNGEEQAAAVEWYRRAGGALGTVVPGVALVGVGSALLVVGVRRGRTDNAQLGLSPGGIAVRF